MSELAFILSDEMPSCLGMLSTFSQFAACYVSTPDQVRCSLRSLDNCDILLGKFVVTLKMPRGPTTLKLPEAILCILLLSLADILGLDYLLQALLNGKLLPIAKVFVILSKGGQVDAAVVNIRSELQLKYVLSFELAAEWNER
jgi:hypothetical protein